MIQVILHWLGDFVTQSDWMALNKTKRSFPCFIHCLLYTLPFGFIADPLALLVIFISHFILDRWSLAKYLIYAKNHLTPDLEYMPWESCSITGYYDGPLNDLRAPVTKWRPFWITVWLYIITDNGLHIVSNYLAIKYL